MIRAIFLDTSPLGILTAPITSPQTNDCKRWLSAVRREGVRIIVPEIADYEVRRELIRAKKMEGVVRLDEFCQDYEYLPLTTVAMRKAADFWAQVRQAGKPTADNKALDGDVILAAQVFTLGVSLEKLIVATINVGHISRFVPAKNWQEITIEG